MCVSEAHVMVVETVEMNSSSSPRLCIFNNLAIIDTPVQQWGRGTTHINTQPQSTNKSHSQPNIPLITQPTVYQTTHNLKFKFGTHTFVGKEDLLGVVGKS